MNAQIGHRVLAGELVESPHGFGGGGKVSRQAKKPDCVDEELMTEDKNLIGIARAEDSEGAFDALEKILERLGSLAVTRLRIQSVPVGFDPWAALIRVCVSASSGGEVGKFVNFQNLNAAHKAIDKRFGSLLSAAVWRDYDEIGFGTIVGVCEFPSGFPTGLGEFDRGRVACGVSGVCQALGVSDELDSVHGFVSWVVMSNLSS